MRDTPGAAVEMTFSTSLWILFGRGQSRQCGTGKLVIVRPKRNILIR
jgi:hypothetical protein